MHDLLWEKNNSKCQFKTMASLWKDFWLNTIIRIRHSFTVFLLKCFLTRTWPIWYEITTINLHVSIKEVSKSYKKKKISGFSEWFISTNPQPLTYQSIWQLPKKVNTKLGKLMREKGERKGHNFFSDSYLEYPYFLPSIL